MWQLIGAESGREYTRHKDKEALYRLLIKEWPTKGKMRRGKHQMTAYHSRRWEQ